MEANLRKCLITTRQSLFCATFFDSINIFLSDSKKKNPFQKTKKWEL
jgi:hypothetical protein